MANGESIEKAKSEIVEGTIERTRDRRSLLSSN